MLSIHSLWMRVSHLLASCISSFFCSLLSLAVCFFSLLYFCSMVCVCVFFPSPLSSSLFWIETSIVCKNNICHPETLFWNKNLYIWIREQIQIFRYRESIISFRRASTHDIRAHIPFALNEHKWSTDAREAQPESWWQCVFKSINICVIRPFEWRSMGLSMVHFRFCLYASRWLFAV